MSDNRPAVLIGYSGHGYVVAEAAISSGHQLIYYADKSETVKNPYNLAYLGNEREESFRGWSNNLLFFLGIGDNNIRDSIGRLLKEKEEAILSVIHPHACLATNIEIGSGVLIGRGAAVNSFVTIHPYAILNTGCIVEHECVIERAAHIAPGAVLAGNVKVGKRSFIGANAVVKQGTSIGNDVIVGAGSVVLHDIPDNEVWVGNPAKKLRSNRLTNSTQN